MTKPRYLGCAAGSQVPGISVAPAGYAWNVNLDNGNSNRNHQDNHYHALAVRAGECHGSVSFASLYAAYRAARRGKKPSRDQLAFDATWIDQLFELEAQLLAKTWHPSPPTYFIATEPKAREIHAPAFCDRVVHHWLVPKLEVLFEPTFIFDSFSNRKSKGTHAAVARLRKFVRQVDSGQGGGFYLQLDVRNFFNSIHRPTLWAMLKRRMDRAGLPEVIQRVAHALLNYPIERTGVIRACTDAERAAVPEYKRLENAAPGCGLAIGNLSSQFFANLYLDRLDQFIKHELKAQRYLRYVDDFVLVHQNREQLEAWRVLIEDFLRTSLRLELKADQRLRPLSAGVDFLGYVVFPTHTVVRRRVVGHVRARLANWECKHVKDGFPTAGRAPLDQLLSVWASYAGHFRHASSYRLRQRLFARFQWLAIALVKNRKNP